MTWSNHGNQNFMVVSQDHGTPLFFSLFLKITCWNFAHIIYFANVIYLLSNFFSTSGFSRSSTNLWFSNGTLCIFLLFWILQNFLEPMIPTKWHFQCQTFFKLNFQFFNLSVPLPVRFSLVSHDAYETRYALRVKIHLALCKI